MTYAAYLRIYEPVSAFGEPDRSRWAAYAASASRPRRRDSLWAEHAEALRRAVVLPQMAVPQRESEHAYVRSADGITYVCPWQTRLRCLLASRHMLSGVGSPVAETAGTAGASGFPGTDGTFGGKGTGGAARLYILGSVWTVPLAWFVPFGASERWLALGSPGRRSAGSGARMLIYTTAMSRARRRVARAQATLRGVPPGRETAGWDAIRAEAELAEVGRWLEEFHPHSLVELDYGGLVHLASDDVLRGDESAAEVRAALEGLAKGECGLAIAMYERAHSRWRAFAEAESAN